MSIPKPPVRDQSDRPLSLANRVTIARILGIPVFIYFMYSYTLSIRQGVPDDMQRILALIVFMLVAATDALDGYLARSRNEITRLGIILDPIADKLLLLSALILLTRPSLEAMQPQIPVALTALAISRDVLLFGGAAIIHHFIGHVHIAPRASGKCATFLLMLTIVWTLFDAPRGPFIYLAWTTAVVIGVSFAQYLVDGIRQMEKIPHQ